MAPSSKSHGRNFSSPPPPPIDSSLPSDVSVCDGSKRKKRKTSNAPSTRTNASSAADTNRQSRSRLSLAEPSKKLPERKARVGGKPSDNAKKEMALRVRSKGAGKSRVESISKLFSSSDHNILVGGHGSNWELSKSARGKSISGSSKPQPDVLPENMSGSDFNILVGGQGSNWELSSFERGKSISDSSKPQPLKFSDQQNVIAGGQRSNDRGGKSISGSSKPQPLENIWIDEASPKSSSPVTEPQQPLSDEEDLSYTNSHLTFEQIAENAKKIHELMLAESESESDDNGMQCNCVFNNCTCLKSYYEYLAHDFEELDFSLD